MTGRKLGRYLDRHRRFGLARIPEPAMDEQRQRQIFIRLLLIALCISAILTVGYLLIGEKLLHQAYEGETFGGLVKPHRADGRTFEQYAAPARIRFWSNAVVGLPLSIIVIFLLLKLYGALFRRISDKPTYVEQWSDPDPPGSVWIAAGVYIALTAALFAPIFGVFARNMIGPPGDNMGCFWTLNWAYEHVFYGHQGFWYINDILYPEGATFYLHAWSFYNLYLFVGLRQLFEPVVCYNLLILHTFVCAGIGGYLLAKYFLRNHWLALLAGFLFAFNPAHIERAVHHMNIATIQFIPLFVLFYIKAIRNESRTSLILATVFLLCNALVDWNYLIFGGWFMFFSYIYLAIRRRKWWLSDVALKSAVAFGAALVVLSPLIVNMLKPALGGGMTGMGGSNNYVVDLSALVAPSPLHLLGGFSIPEFINSLHTATSSETTGYLGLIAVVLFVFLFRKIVSESAKFILGGVSFLLMSLGAQPHLFGLLVPALVPSLIVSYLPVLSNSRAPSRFIVFVYLFWSIIIAIGIGKLWQMLTQSRGLRGGLVAGIILLLAVDYYGVVGETSPVVLPTCYGAIPREQAPFGILDLPGGYVQSGRYMMYQNLHGYPIVQGWVSRRAGTTLLDRLDLKNLAEQHRQLNAAAVKYIVIHKQFLPDSTVSPAAYRAQYESLYDDSLNTVYKVY